MCKLCLISAQIYAFNPLFWLHFISLAVYTQNSHWRRRRREIMQVITFSSHLKSFNVCSNRLVSLCTCLIFIYASFCIAPFAEWKWCKHARDNRNSAFQYFKLHQISSRRSPSSKSNKWAITVSVHIFNIWHKYSWTKK